MPDQRPAVDTPVQAAGTGIAPGNPAPLGLCGFALTTFVLSAANAGWYHGPQIVIGLALFYGGLAQLLAGMWEFKAGNTFGATAFSSYGGFWLAVAATLQWHLIAEPAAFGFFLLGWTIFTGMMFLATLRVNWALIWLFGLLFVTFALLTISSFVPGSPEIGTVGGYLGVIVALIAWYTALAGLLASSPKPAFLLPVGPRG